MNMGLLNKLLFITTTLILITGCGGGGGSSDNSFGSGAAGSPVQGAGVKGPLFGADVTAYRIDTRQVDLKGERVAQGSTNSSSAALELLIPSEYVGSGPFIIEFVGGTERNGSTPVIETLQTILTDQQLASGTAIYATPLSSFAIAHAQKTADKQESNSDPLTTGLAGDSNGTVSLNEFLAALETSSNNIKATLGLGILTADINLFTTSPIIKADTAQEKTLAIRTANEVFAAIVNNLTTEIAGNGLVLSGSTVLKSLADDFSDGTFDKQNDSQPINTLTSITDISATFTANPQQLTVPGTNITIAELNDLLASEAVEMEPDLPTVELTPPALELPAVSVYPNGNPEPTPTPEPNQSAPIVSFSQPQAGASFTEGQSIAVSVSASDSDGNIQNCRLTSNGQLVRQDSTSPYAWGPGSGANDSMLSNLLAGNYTFVSTCTDNDGLTTSASVSVSVTAVPGPQPTLVAPNVSFASPTANSTFTAGDTVNVTVNATDTDGSVDNCRLSIGNQLIRQDSTSPYTWGTSSSDNDALLDNMSEGSYTLEAICTDDDGLTASSQLNFSVEAPAPLPPTISLAALDTINEGSDLPVTVNVSTINGAIDYCDLTLNGQLVRRDSSAPYQFGTGSGFNDSSLNNLPAGSYNLTALCIDQNNLTATVALSITVIVTEPILHSVSLAWGIPTTRVDGTPLMIGDIASYEIFYYASSAGINNGQTITVTATDGAGNHVNAYTINDLLAGEYYFSLAAVDTANNVSEFVSPVPLNIQ